MKKSERPLNGNNNSDESQLSAMSDSSKLRNLTGRESADLQDLLSGTFIGRQAVAGSLKLTRCSAEGVPIPPDLSLNIFDDSKMTQCAIVLEHDAIFRSPSDRIAMYLSPKAVKMTAGRLKQLIKGSAFESPQPAREPPASSRRPIQADARRASADAANGAGGELERLAFSRSRTYPLNFALAEEPLPPRTAASHRRFRQLLANIGPARIEPLAERLVHGAMRRAGTEAFRPDGGRRDAMVSEMLAELQIGYEESIRAAISECALLPCFLFVFLSDHICVYLSVCLHVYLSIYLSICLSIYLSITWAARRASTPPSITALSISVSMTLSLCLCLSASVPVSFYPSMWADDYYEESIRVAISKCALSLSLSSLPAAPVGATALHPDPPISRNLALGSPAKAATEHCK